MMDAATTFQFQKLGRSTRIKIVSSRLTPGVRQMTHDDVIVGIEESTHDDDEALTSIQNTITTKHHPPSDGSNDTN